MEFKTWIADESKEGLTLIRRKAEEYMEDNGRRTQDGCKETSIG